MCKLENKLKRHGVDISNLEPEPDQHYKERLLRELKGNNSLDDDLPSQEYSYTLIDTAEHPTEGQCCLVMRYCPYTQKEQYAWIFGFNYDNDKPEELADKAKILGNVYWGELDIDKSY